MRATGYWVIAAVMVTSCARGGDPADNGTSARNGASSAGKPAKPAAGWDLQASGEGSALALTDASGTVVIRLFCPAGRNQLLVNVPAFRPIASEERLSFGSGGTVTALVADPTGDRQRGGVSGVAPVPDDLKGLVEGPISASYGAQTSGPQPALPLELQRQFVTACFDGATAERQAAARPTPATSPCHVQDGELLRLTPMRAIGTEPFWGAQIDGRCVTYSHPDDQKGTRVWTKFNSGPVGGIWSGTLNGKPFVLTTDPTSQCSDGMSDRVYPIAVELTVNGEKRRGCADRVNTGR